MALNAMVSYFSPVSNPMAKKLHPRILVAILQFLLKLDFYAFAIISLLHHIS